MTLFWACRLALVPVFAAHRAAVFVLQQLLGPGLVRVLDAVALQRRLHRAPAARHRRLRPVRVRADPRPISAAVHARPEERVLHAHHLLGVGGERAVSLARACPPRCVARAALLMGAEDRVWLLDHPLVGRSQARGRARHRSLVLGHVTLYGRAAHGARKGCDHLRVRAPAILRAHSLTPLAVFGQSTPSPVRRLLRARAPVLTVRSAIPGAFAFTMCFLPLYVVVAPAIGFSIEYQGMVSRLWTNWIFYLMMLLIPAVCLARDFVWK
jgi:hypothetical protein